MSDINQWRMSVDWRTCW